MRCNRIMLLVKMKEMKEEQFFYEKTEETSFKEAHKKEIQKIIYLLSDSNNEEFKFSTKIRKVIGSQTRKTILLNLRQKLLNICNYYDAYILVPGDITVNAVDDTNVAFKNCAQFSKCKTEITDVFVDEANLISIALPMYNLTY